MVKTLILARDFGEAFHVMQENGVDKKDALYVDNEWTLRGRATKDLPRLVSRDFYRRRDALAILDALKAADGRTNGKR